MTASDAFMGKAERSALVTPILDNNPIGVQVLGICSALAVTTRLDKALVMSVAVTIVVAFANLLTGARAEVSVARSKPWRLHWARTKSSSKAGRLLSARSAATKRAVTVWRSVGSAGLIR